MKFPGGRKMAQPRGGLNSSLRKSSGVDKIPPEQYNQLKIFANLLAHQGENYCADWNALFDDLCKQYKVGTISKDLLKDVATKKDQIVASFLGNDGRYFLVMDRVKFKVDVCDRCTRLATIGLIVQASGKSTRGLPDLCEPCSERVASYLDEHPVVTR